MKVNYLIYFLSIFFFFACVSSKHEAKNENVVCKQHLNSLASVIKHEGYGIYKVEHKTFYPPVLPTLLDSFRKAYPGSYLSKVENTRMDLFETYVDTLFNSNLQCNCEWTNQAIMKKLGHPTEIEYDGSYVYKLDYGEDCPCANCDIFDVFDYCTAFVIRFNKQGYVQGKVTFRKRTLAK